MATAPAPNHRHMRRRGAFCLPLALFLCPAAAAAAEPNCHPPEGLSTCVTADNLWPHAGGQRWLSQAPSQTIASGTVAFAFTTTYIHRPIGLAIASPDPDGTTFYAVEHALNATLALAIGISDHLHVSFAAPFVPYQTGSSTADVLGTDERLPRSAVGDLRFGTTVALLKAQPDDRGLAMSARFQMSAPTGDRDAFVAAPSATFAPGASLSYRFDKLALGADVSGRLRRKAELAGTVIGSQIVASLGASYDALADQWLTISLETFGLLGLAPQFESGFIAQPEPSDRPHLPAEWMLSVHSAGLSEGRLRATLAGGSFIPTGASLPATTPLFRIAARLSYLYE